ncbi:MAG: hypothetical protein ACTSSG_11250 [Candidatus Heimdallarchaeaceae archaeon]
MEAFWVFQGSDTVEEEDELKSTRKHRVLSWKIRKQYLFDDFYGMIVEGKQRIGKSSYISLCMAEALGKWEYHPEVICVEPNFEAVKPWVVFRPKDFLNVVFEVTDKGEKQPAIFWDDAGVWLFSLDWYKPFVKSVVKYLQVAGTQFGFIFFTTPSQTMISSKILQAFPQIYLCRISKTGRDTYTVRKRIAKVYESWGYPDGKKGGVWSKWIDKYNCILPNSYYDWYKPIRDSYIKIAIKLMKIEYERIVKKVKTVEDRDSLMEEVYQVAPDESKIKELNEIIKNLEKSI